MSRYSVNEIFYSLQGEGANTGRPAVFVRFSGCNLCCPFCDTDFHSGADMSGEAILRQLADYPARFVVLTGGEPALQVDEALIQLLRQAGYTVAEEGTVRRGGQGAGGVGSDARPAVGRDERKQHGAVVLCSVSPLELVWPRPGEALPRQ